MEQQNELAQPMLQTAGLLNTFSYLVKIKKRKNRVVNQQNFFASLPTNLKRFYEQTTYLPLVKSLKIEIESDIEKCHALWEEFSPKESLFDTWDFRLGFYLAYKHQPHFIVLKSDGENVGLLPLWYEDDKKKYYWFGSYWHEDNKFFVKNPILTPLLLHLCPPKTSLDCIASSGEENIAFAKKFFKFGRDVPKYILSLWRVKTLDDYLMQLKKNHRHNLKKDKKRIENQNPQIVINDFSDLDWLIEQSRGRFDEKAQAPGYHDDDEDTGWHDERRVNSFKELVKLSGGEFTLRMLSVKINGKTAGADLAALYNNCFYALVCGYDVKNFPGIGNYFNVLDIEEALELKMKKVDFLQNSYHWKDKWFKSVPLLRYEV